MWCGLVWCNVISCGDVLLYIATVNIVTITYCEGDVSLSIEVHDRVRIICR
jgi:hypothetical protein